jgi:F-type H+-transporting ATPase subunit gamma
MLSTRDLRRRIRSVGGTAQITRAMQMVAASKMRKAQEASVAARPFARLVYQIQRKLTTRVAGLRDPLMETREARRRAVILIAADKGLCGALNANVFRLAAEFDPQSTVFITAGRKAAQFVAVTRRQLAAEFAYGDSPTFAEARAIAVFARDLFLRGDVDEVWAIATRFINTMTQEAVRLEFLPVGPVGRLASLDVESDEQIAGTSEVMLEPNSADILHAFLRRYLNVFLYLMLLSAKASEQSARMVAMKNATDSAEALIGDLTLEYNKMRQGNITKELLEIAGGQSA